MKTNALTTMTEGRLPRLRLFASPAVDCADAATLRRLYEATGRAAVSKTERLVGRLDVAEEVVHEVFLRLWQQKLTFPSEKQAYYWIYKSCHNAGIDHLRAAASRLEHGQESGWLERVQDAGDLADAAQTRRLVTAALARLDEREARILAYTAIDGMTQDEIADLLGVSRKTVGRVMKRLEEKLSEFKEAAR